MASLGPWRVVIVDDHPMMRQAVVETIEQNLPNVRICGQAADQPSAAAMIVQQKPDLAIVDLTLDKGHGIDLIKQVRAAAPGVKVLVFSLHDESLYAERAMRAGAAGYVCKKAEPRLLIEAIRRVMSGDGHVSDDPADRMIGRLSQKDHHRPAGLEELSDRELEVFELMGQGHTIRQIATAMNVSAKTVDVYRQRLKSKLGIKDNSELARQAVAHVIHEG